MINHVVSGFTREQALLLRAYHPILKLAYDPDIQGIFLLGGELASVMGAFQSISAMC